MSTPYAKVPVLTVHVGPAYEALTALDIAVWYSLCSFARWVCNGKGEPIHSIPGSCFPTMKAIARRARLSERAARRSVRRLELLGHVVTEVRRNEKDGRKSNGYILYCFPQLSAEGGVPPRIGATADDIEAEMEGEERQRVE